MRHLRYPSAADITALHDKVLLEGGGERGIIIEGNLEFAVAQMRLSRSRSIFTSAAYLMRDLLVGHPFLDGNKRTAIASVALFLRMNGYAFRVARVEEAYDFLTRVIAGEALIQEMAEQERETMTSIADAVIRENREFLRFLAKVDREGPSAIRSPAIRGRVRARLARLQAKADGGQRA